MRCLILGGGGFLGSHLCQALLSAGHIVRIFDLPNLQHVRELPNENSVEWVYGSFLDIKDVKSALEDCDIVFHLISTTLPSSSNESPVYDVDTNITNTICLLDAACELGITKIVFASSGGTVYGIPNEIPISEAHPTNPICSYGICKLAIEKYLHLYHIMHGLEYCILRMANPFGERQRVSAGQGAVSAFLQKSLLGETIEIWGDGSVVRDYFYVADAASALRKAADYSGSNRIFNIGSGVGRSLNEIISTIEGILGKSVSREYLPGRSFDVQENVLDISLARDALDWKPEVSFEDGMAKTLAWIEEHAS